MKDYLFKEPRYNDNTIIPCYSVGSSGVIISTDDNAKYDDNKNAPFFLKGSTVTFIYRWTYDGK